jgi:cytochrome c biogenesis factor
MAIGYGVVWAGVLCALASVGLYLLSGKFPALLRWARVAFVGAFAAIVAAEGLLIYALLTGRYDLQYVFSFSEESLTPLFKIASAWAGQDGRGLRALGDDRVRRRGAAADGDFGVPKPVRAVAKA